MEDYQIRYINEYNELKERYQKLCQIIFKYEQDKLDFKLNCPIYLLKQQARHMKMYLEDLEIRSLYEGVTL